MVLGNYLIIVKWRPTSAYHKIRLPLHSFECVFRRSRSNSFRKTLCFLWETSWVKLFGLIDNPFSPSYLGYGTHPSYGIQGPSPCFCFRCGEYDHREMRCRSLGEAVAPLPPLFFRSLCWCPSFLPPFPRRMRILALEYATTSNNTTRLAR